MANEVNAGDFETLFAQALDQKIRAGAKLDPVLIQGCYEAAGALHNLPRTNSDSLHIQEITQSLAGRAEELARLSPQRAQKLIFDLVYMH